MDWTSLFGLSVSPLELFVRGSAIYWFLFLILRIVLRRDVGAIGAADVLLIVLIADASQNAMAGEYKSITDGFILIGTIVGWNYLINWAGFHSPRIAALLEAPALLLVHHGRILHRNLRKELITTEELMSKLREQGIEKVDQVKAARLESSGEVSVIRTNEPASKGAK